MHASDAEPDRDHRVVLEQVNILFRNVVLGVVAAAVTAWVVALGPLGSIPFVLRMGWAVLVTIAALAHLALFALYQRRRERWRWRKWSTAFTAIAAIEGVIWGWMPVAVAAGGLGFETEMIGVVVALAVASGAIPAFSAFYPAFAVFLIPTTLPYAIWSAFVPGPVYPATTILMFIFVAAFLALGLGANRSVKELVWLRLQAADLAERLRHEKEVAEAANRSKSSFLAAASHDLRQPVHALGLFVGALRTIPMNDEGQQLVAQIEASTNAMDGLFSALLDISRLDAGIVEVHEADFDIGEQLRRICSEHAHEAATKNVLLQCAPSSAIVRSDPVLVERIIRNLISNAIRYTDHGRVLVGCRRRRGALAVQVLDTGRGIPAELQSKVFEEYFQLGNPERDRTKGLGLGLAIVRRLAELLGLEVGLTSITGRGSCFEIVIPMASPQALPARPDHDERTAPAKGLVVVIDDERAIRDGMAALLVSWGYDVVSAASGDETIELLSQRDERPVVIVSDYRLRAGETGLAVIERLQTEYNESIPAILITGDTSPGRLAEAYASGLLLLHKPVKNSRLRAALANLSQIGRVSEEPKPA